MINFRTNLGMNAVGSAYMSGLVLDFSTAGGLGLVRKNNNLRN